MLWAIRAWRFDLSVAQQSQMKFGRFKKEAVREIENFAWNKALTRRREALLSMGTWKLGAPDAIIEMNVRLFLEAYHKGPWRMIWSLVKHELLSVWMHYGFFKWEWIRTWIFRRPPDEILAEAQRVWDESDAVEELAKNL